jgi:hypothetical protein
MRTHQYLPRLDLTWRIYKLHTWKYYVPVRSKTGASADSPSFLFGPNETGVISFMQDMIHTDKQEQKKRKKKKKRAGLRTLSEVY